MLKVRLLQNMVDISMSQNVSEVKMDKRKIDRINYLARKSKTEGLTNAERAEQQALRNEYREGFRRSLTVQLENTYCIDEYGNKIKISDRNAEKLKEHKENKK